MSLFTKLWLWVLSGGLNCWWFSRTLEVENAGELVQGYLGRVPLYSITLEVFPSSFQRDPEGVCQVKSGLSFHIRHQFVVFFIQQFAW